MYTLKRTNSKNFDSQNLVKELDKDLAIRDGEEHDFFSQFNTIDNIRYVIVAYENDIAVGCGAIKNFDENTMEIKRMFVAVDKRGKGIASLVLEELEKWTKELNFSKCILETGVKQPEAIHLYKKNGYKTIPNYGQYAHVKSSICFEKEMNEVI
ncbi:MAG: GNAT family N-acetyltransferase [Cloacibacterium sp.]|nr:GNAT family N-acetyltransferase [Cloacibacterium sp.]